MAKWLQNTRQLFVYLAISVIAATCLAWATQTNYLGTVFIADNNTPANQLSVNANGALTAASENLTVTGSVTSATNLVSQDATGFSSFNFQYTSVGTGNAVTPESSHDNTNWVSIPCNPSVSPHTPLTGTLYNCALTARYFRLRVSSYSSGTVAISGTFRTTPFFQSVSSVISGGDSQSAGFGSQTFARGQLNNGSTGWDDARSNVNSTILSSAARTTTLQSSDQVNYNGRCAHVVLDVTNAGTGSITLTIQGKDVLSSKYYTLLAGAAVTTNSTNVYKVCPGITAAANVSAADMLPRTWRVDVTHNNANSITYSVGASVSAN